MNRMPALGVNWNRMDPYVRYSPYDFPVVETPYAYPVIQEPVPQVMVTPAPASMGLPTWAIIGGSVLAGLAVGALLLPK